MAVLGPNLKNDVPKYLEWARLAQYSSFQCQQRWWGPFGQKDILGGPSPWDEGAMGSCHSVKD